MWAALGMVLMFAIAEVACAKIKLYLLGFVLIIAYILYMFAEHRNTTKLHIYVQKRSAADLLAKGGTATSERQPLLDQKPNMQSRPGHK